MPALVNYGTGDDEFYSAGSFCASPTDLGRLCSIGSNVDVYCSPRKRARISAPFLFSGIKFEQNNQPTIEVLPNECLIEIFKRLPEGKERSACACVSKQWLMQLTTIRKAEFCKETTISLSDDVEMVLCDEAGMESDGYLTRNLEGKKATDMRLAAIAVGTSSRGGLGKLSIRGSNSTHGVSNIGLSAIARGCPSLRSLSLWDVPCVGDDGLVEIAKECHLLEKLDLCHCPLVSNKGLIALAENCPNLTTLNFESCSRIGNEGLQAIGKFCPRLRSISIKDCHLVSDHGVSSLFSSTSSVLTMVKLQALKITDFSLAVIGHYGKGISNLVLCGLQNVSEKGFWVMGNAHGLHKLVSLTITSCRGMTDVSLEAIGKGCTNLKQMCLRKCCFVSDNGLVAFAKAAGSLESLQLEECNRVSQNGVMGLLSNCGTKLKCLTLVKCMGIKDMSFGMPMQSSCSSLRSLSVRNCPGFGSASLALVAKLCPQLQHVDLSGSYGITDAGFLPLLENCEAGLIRVNLSGCFNLTDEVVFALARLHGTTLETLNLDGCSKITDASLVSVAGNCMFLRDLDLSKCSISDSGIAVLSHAEQLNLQILSLSGCSDVSNKSMHSLRKLGRTLVGLNLQHCNSISSSMVELLVESLWRCDILF
ncbi:F-box-like domain-containing protein/LRR_6 domain-containing protein [Cephalotus follicularis]|uniref:F-box-like domain-containing protein/LRR_6 domain-containing protein n=1 Tax=Cephalotus follicularis TaxID=3775 RepID=A0A1Q3CQJ7_CEPFO|nr:F-box-like domain-containing protein/LRR_6 domain-containing protein [Cephalotus follicularis]